MKIITLLAVAALTTGLFSGCGTFMGTSSSSRFTADPSIPAAEGTVNFTKARNGNTGIEIAVKHLAEPAKLDPPATTYVAWVQGAGEAAPRNIGALTVDKNLSGRLKTLTPLTQFELFITAEPSGQVEQPSGQPLLRTNYSK